MFNLYHHDELLRRIYDDEGRTHSLRFMSRALL
jgi:hypothetical protein